MSSVSVMNSEEGKHRLLPKLATLSAHQQQRGWAECGNHVVWQVHTGTRQRNKPQKEKQLAPFSCLLSLLFNRINVCDTANSLVSK